MYVIPHNTTPPHPRPKLHDVANTRAINRCWACRASPRFATNPSIVPSKSESVNGRCRLKCTIINVNNANKAVAKWKKFIREKQAIDCTETTISKTNLPIST